MLPDDCPAWEYEDHPDHVAILAGEIQGLLIDICRDRLEPISASRDTKPVHRRLFIHLTPEAFPYYAGNYRGSDYRCLVDYEVMIGRMSGAPARQVSSFMRGLGEFIERSILQLDDVFSLPEARYPEAEKLKVTVATLAEILADFLIIHPYANGNGHIGRFIVWLILGRYGYWIQDWPIDPRPADPPYTELVRLCISGFPEPLETHIYERLLPIQPP